MDSADADDRPIPTPTRRRVLRQLAWAVGAAMAPLPLGGCRGLSLPAALTPAASRPALTVCLLGGSPPSKQEGQIDDAMDIGPVLATLAEPLRLVCVRARNTVPGVGRVALQTINTSFPWFPVPSFPTNPQPIVDDPTIPMPDIVIAPHDVVASTLAVRALDLGAFVTQSVGASDLAGIPGAVWRQGRAYAPGRGTFQAAVPLLRNPLMCLVPDGVSSFSGGRPWTTEAFAATLPRLATGLQGSETVLPFVPYASGVAEMAAVGSGGTLAQTTPSAAFAAFGRRPSSAGIAETVRWTEYASPTWMTGTCVTGYRYRMLIALASEILGGPPQIPTGAAVTPGPWSLAPLPAFSARPAVPLNNVDVMVWRDTRAPDVAWAFATHLLSRDVQNGLVPFGLGLALRPEQAVATLTGRTAAQQAQWLADPQHDITAEDAYGTETDANRSSLSQVRGALRGALRDLTGVAGGFYDVSRFLAASPGIDVLPGMRFLADGAMFPPSALRCKGFVAQSPAEGDVQQVLSQYATRAVGG